MPDTPIKIFVDTNGLIDAEDSSMPFKQECAADWLDVLWRRRCGALSVQILNEFYVNATGKTRPPLPKITARSIVSKLVGSLGSLMCRPLNPLGWAKRALACRIGIVWSSLPRSMVATAKC